MSAADEQPPRPLRGAPQALVFDGILDGRVRDARALRVAVEQLSACGAGAFRVDFTGGRFNLLPVDTQVPPERFDEAAQSNFLDRLHAVVDAAQPNSVETTLRCKLVYEDEVTETLFVVREGAVEPLSRRRPKGAQDAPALPPSIDEPALGLRRRELFLIAPLLLVVGVLYAWQSGYVDRILAARAETLTTDPGPFGDMVDVAVVRSWGNYEVTLTRGAGYPETPEALQARRDAGETLAQQAACAVVGDGDELYVQLQNADGEVLEQTPARLRRLLSDPDAEVVVELSGRVSGGAVALSLSGDDNARSKDK
ncbi:MAG: hypothetical protein ACON4Z_11535 [Planctomycetota bacterium]